jgi:hypothetical protein
MNISQLNQLPAILQYGFMKGAGSRADSICPLYFDWQWIVIDGTESSDYPYAQIDSKSSTNPGSPVSPARELGACRLSTS